MIKQALVLLVSCNVLFGATFYVAPSGGSDANPGTVSQPFATIAFGISTVQPGDTLILKNGVYNQRIVIQDKSGASGAPITVKAETDFGVTLLGPIAGSSPYAHVFLRRADWWVLQGMRVQDSYGYSVWLYGCQYTTLRKMVVIRPGNTGNTHAFAIHGDSVGWPGDTGRPGAFNLIEDCIAVYLHRHGFYSGAGAISNVVRRCYLNSMGRTYASGTRGAVEAASNYGGSHNIYENIVVGRSDYIGITANGTVDGGVGNRYLGCVVLGSERSGFLVNARTTDPDGFVTNNWNINCVVLDRPTYNNQLRSSAGFSSWHGKDNYVSNCFSLSQNEAFEVNQEQFFWDPDSAYGAARDPALQFANFNVKMNNNVGINSEWGFLHTWDDRTSPDSSDMPYGGVHTTYSTNNLAYGNSTANQTITSAPQVVVNQSGFVTADPGYNTAKYGDGAYLMPAPNYPTRGATVLYRYENGVLTSTPLWPWPTDAQITAEIGMTATYEASGGIWKTLDDVYGTTKTFYVRKDGSDSNTGTADNAGGAFLTIGKAASVVNPGDTVNVRQGTYAEFVTLTRAGTDAAPITWNFERDGSGNYLAIIDPSTTVSSSWVLAPEKDPNGNGVYKHTSFPFDPGVLIADGKMIPRMERPESAGYIWDVANSSISPAGSTWINAPANATRIAPGSTATGLYWDGIDALWAYENSTAYIRFRNGDNPNSKAIKISPNNGVTLDVWLAKTALRISAGYNIVNGAYVKNARAGVAISATGTQTITGSVVMSNKIESCTMPLGIYGSGDNGQGNAANVYSNAMVFNTPSLNYIRDPSDPGAWRNNNSADWKAWHSYTFYKTQVSNANSSRPAMRLFRVGDSNLVSGNIINGAGSALLVDNTSVQAQYTIISSNHFSNLSSAAVLLGNGNGTDLTHIHDNTFEDVALPLRWHRANMSYNAATESRTYMYRNWGWNPPSGTATKGSVIYLYIEGTAQTFISELWLYHNTFEAFEYGIDGVVQISDQPTFLADNNLLSKTHVINNIINVGNTMRHESFLPAANDFGRFSHNRIREWSGTPPSWFGENIINANYEWGTGSPPASEPDFLITTNSLAWNSGTNLSGLGLPDNRTVDSGEWDIGAHEFVVEEGTETPPVSIYFAPQDVGGIRNLSETGDPIELRVNRSAADLSGSLSGTWTWSGELTANVDYTVTDNDAGTTDDHLNWTIPAGEAYQTYYATAIPDGIYTGPRNGIVTVQPGISYTPSGGPAYFVWVDAENPPSVGSGPDRPGQFRPPHTTP